jgi:type IV pilus assembly protein PilA
MVVVLILGILLAIALPTFIGARTRAEKAAAKSSLRVALPAGRVIYATSSARDPNGRYLDATIPELQGVECSINCVDGTTSSNPTTVSKDTTTGVLYLAAFSQSGTCFFMLDDPPNDTRYGSVTGGLLRGEQRLRVVADGLVTLSSS